MIFVSATKVIENGTLLRMSEVMADVLPFDANIAVLSGPTFAREVASGEPAAVVVASDHAVASRRGSRRRSPDPPSVCTRIRIRLAWKSEPP